MTAIQKACYGLIVSACVMGALLVANMQDRFISTADADLIHQREANSPVMMTVTTMPGQDSLFILDNPSRRILIFQLDVNKRRMDLAGSIDLGSQELFGGGNFGDNEGNRGRMPR